MKKGNMKILLLTTMLLIHSISAGWIKVPDGKEQQAKDKLRDYPNLSNCYTNALAERDMYSNDNILLEITLSNRIEEHKSMKLAVYEYETKNKKLNFENKLCKGGLAVLVIYFIIDGIVNLLKK